MDWPHTTFSDQLRAELVRRGGDPTSRRALQDLGKEYVERRPVSFCQSVLDAARFTPGDSLIVDGVRHVDIYRQLSAMVAPSISKLIFLSASHSERAGRSTDLDTEALDGSDADGHAVEFELVDALPAIADLVVDASTDFSLVVGTCGDAIKEWVDELSRG